MKAWPSIRWDGSPTTDTIPRQRAARLLKAARSRRASNVIRCRAGWWVRDAGLTLSTRHPGNLAVPPSRRAIAALFRNPAAPPVAVGLSWFAPVAIEGRRALQARNWHGAGSVIASVDNHASDPAELVRAIWANRHHYRKPFPLSDHYK